MTICIYEFYIITSPYACQAFLKKIGVVLVTNSNYIKRRPDGWGCTHPLTGLLYCEDCGA
jgi:hypothetical protein